MITAVLHRDINNETPVFLDLPASRWDVLTAKAQLGVDNLNKCGFEFEPSSDLPQAGKVLHGMRKGPNFFNEVNYFAQRISELSHENRILLNGTIAIYGPEDMKSLINLTWHLDDIVMGDAGSDEELGRFLIENEMVDFPEEIVPFLDFTKVGEHHRANHTAAFDRNLYYEDLSPGIEEIYDGRNLPEMPDWVFRVEMQNINVPPEDALHIILTLPASQEEIDQTMIDLEVSGIDEIQIERCHSRISDIHHFDRADLADLNNLATLISEMGDDTYLKFMAVVEHQRLHEAPYDMRCNNAIGGLSQAAYRLDEYDFTPGIRPEDIGSYGLVQRPNQAQEMAQEIEAQKPSPDFDMQMGGF